LCAVKAAREDGLLSVSDTSENTPREIYDRAKREYERHVGSACDARAWGEFAVRLMEWIVQAQTAGLESQRRVTDAIRDSPTDKRLPQLHSELRDANYFVDRLTALHRKVTENLLR